MECPTPEKSSVAPLIAEKMSREFVDLDLEIEKFSGEKIDDIFKKYGEAKFREIETEVCKKFGKLNGLVISTGGGVVTREENYRPLKQNGKIYLLKERFE